MKNWALSDGGAGGKKTGWGDAGSEEKPNLVLDQAFILAYTLNIATCNNLVVFFGIGNKNACG
ncbi:hypothetical protein [Bacillus cereus]|uniref:hypothetical protein n=1 Tax=Bacillus cereus TaxID=1396 RepID=UPI0011457D90|nr:hypothetical protein [Bacillus cereus]